MQYKGDSDNINKDPQSIKFGEKLRDALKRKKTVLCGKSSKAAVWFVANVDCLSVDATQFKLGEACQLQHGGEKQSLWKIFSGLRMHMKKKHDVDCLSLASTVAG